MALHGQTKECTMYELTNAWECVPRTGIPNLRPASRLLQTICFMSNHTIHDTPTYFESIVNIKQVSNVIID